MATTTLSPIQTGVEGVGWADGAMAIFPGSTIAYAQFDFSSLNRVLTTAITISFIPTNNATSVQVDSAAAVDLTDRSTYGNASSFQTLRANFSSTNLPSSYPFATTGTLYDGAVLAGAQMVLPTDLTPSPETELARTLRGAFSLGGRVAFRFNANEITAVGSLTVQVTHEPDFTGLVGYTNPGAQADECPRCGGKSTRESWLRDGYTGSLVCPECWDPKPPAGMKRFPRFPGS